MASRTLKLVAARSGVIVDTHRFLYITPSSHDDDFQQFCTVAHGTEVLAHES
jgi:hypothetical protein